MELILFSSAAEAKEALNPGKPSLARAGEHEFVLVLFEDHVFCFENKCPHMGSELHTGTINYLGEIVCPLHTYRFDVRSGNQVNGKCPDLKTYQVQEGPQGLYIHT